MKCSSVFVCLVASLLILSSCAPPPAPEPEPMPEPAPTIEGAWTLEEITTVGGPNEGTVTDPQPSLWVFSQRHYSEMFVVGTEPRALTESQPATDEEALEAHRSYRANSGSYELDGSIIVQRPMVARGPNFMAGGEKSYSYELDGDTLWLVQTPDQRVSGPEVTRNEVEWTEITRKLRRLD